MKRSWVIIGIIVFVAIGGGLVWIIVNRTTSSAPPAAMPGASDSSSSSSSTTSTDTATDMTSSTSVAVTLKDISFQPASIKIKKGTKVTWTNQDSVIHNVVADSADNVAGLPTTSSLIGKGGTYSFTFNTVGTITYHCTPHASSMMGTIEVVE